MINSKIKSLLEYQYSKDLGLTNPDKPSPVIKKDQNLHILDKITYAYFDGKVISTEPEYWNSYGAWAVDVKTVNGKTKRVYYSQKEKNWQYF